MKVGKYNLEIMDKEVRFIVITIVKLCIMIYLKGKISTIGSNMPALKYIRYLRKLRILKQMRQIKTGSKSRAQGIVMSPESVRGNR